eukprot:SAG11_NODE_10516_length_825_cov_1.090909_2_plen_164_part_00
MINSSAFRPQDLDSKSSTNNKCIASGRFYLDWGMKFILPLGMFSFSILLCILTEFMRQLVKIIMVGMLVLLFSSFPMQLQALQVLFCTWEEQLHESDDAPVTRKTVLLVDPSIECWSGPHYVAILVGLSVFVLLVFAFPVMLYHRIKDSLAKGDEIRELSCWR